MSDTHAQTVPFVRGTMLPPEPPPAAETGAVKWLRQNLFSSPLNIALTVLGVLIVFMVLRAALPWLMNSVWNADSLGQCRQIVAEMSGPEATGACWAVIKARWHQFVFGFYPQDLYWRPILAFGLLLVALTPVLFIGQARKGLWMLVGVAVFLAVTLAGIGPGATVLVVVALIVVGLMAVQAYAPERLFWFTLLFPFLGFWLLWGGSVWRPIVALLGFVVLGGVYRLLNAQIGVVLATTAGVVAACLWWMLLQDPVANALNAVIPLGIQGVDSDRFGGFLLAITIGIAAIACSLPMGILLALGRQSDMFLVKTLSVGFIEFIRGVPLITLLFTASLLLKYFLPPNTNFDAILRVIIMVTLFAAAYLAEVIRGGLAALPRGQYEAADALGLDYWKAQQLIIMPQALKIAIPGIVSTFIGLFKDTTLVSFVGLLDPLKGITQIVRADINWKGIYWEPYIFVGLIFFIICFGMSRYSMYLERRLKTDHR
ncbi:MAG: amino acid ABC transporter permease [Paracoccaceae bacterium]